MIVLNNILLIIQKCQLNERHLTKIIFIALLFRSVSFLRDDVSYKKAWPFRIHRQNREHITLTEISVSFVFPNVKTF